MKKITNSFFESDLKNNTVLILVPHQDDEINLAGGLINSLIACNADIKVVYTTNGDFFYSAGTRIKEAKKALSVLGVDRKNIYFLGYGDTPSTDKEKHIFNGINTPIKSEAGYTHTYGEDYAYIKHGLHSDYLLSNYKRDMTDIIMDIFPDIIIAIDYDIHPDHRILSLVFDAVIGEVLKKNYKYKPAIYKGFAYATAYETIEDFYSLNIKSTVKPNSKIVHNYYDDMDMIDTSIYQWDNRIRIPVNEACRAGLLKKNLLFKALLKHESQYAATRAYKIINGDLIYWYRDTSSISYQASITVSSNQKDAERINDFMIINSHDIFTDAPLISDYLWIPDIDDEEKCVEMVWDKEETIKEVKIYSNIRSESIITKMLVVIGNKGKMYIGPFKENGEPLSIILDKPIKASKIRLQILEYKGKEPGIAECEVFTTNEKQNRLPAIIKATIDGEFIYDYYIKRDIKKLKIDIYKTIEVSDNIGYKVIGNSEAYFDNNLLYVNDNDDSVIVQVYDKDNPEIYDRIKIIRLNYSRLIYGRLSLAIDSIISHIICRMQKRYFKWKKKVIKV